MKKSTLTEDKAEKNPTGGVLVGKREGQTIIHNKGTLSGYLVGKTHAEGGIKAINKSTGQALEMQGGEVVITAPAVSDNTKRKFEGKMMTNREILSTINEKGGGVAFAKDGMEIPKSIKRTGASYKYGGKTMTDHEIYKFITGGEFNPKPFLDYYFQEIKDFLEEQNNIKLKEDYTFRFRGKIFTIEPFIKADKNSDQKIKSADFIIYDSEGEVIGEISFNPNNKNKFNANSDFFEWNNIKFATGGMMANGGLLAPNGHKTNLTPEQYKLVRTPKFKAWFGDWENDPENASKVVDENGEPLVVYHGTYVENPFYIFDFDKADLGFHFGTYEQAKNRSETKLFFKGRKSIVNSFFLNIKTIFEATDIGEWEYPQRYIDMFVSDELISEYDAKKNGFYNLIQREENKPIREYLLNKYGKFVGFVYNNKYEGKGKSFIVLNSTQIKLADGTNTTFDSSNPDIRFDDGGSLVKDSKSGNTPARDLNNYNDVLDLQADGMVGADSGLFKDGGLLAPNGHKTNLTPEQYKLVRTPEFKKWFGDWENDPENASKVVDGNGEPMVVYHTTSKDFTIFDKKKSKEGFFFCPNKERLEVYNKSKVDSYFLRIVNPSHEMFKRDLEYLKGKMYDGIMDYGHARKINEYLYEIIAFEPNQIKLADGSNTTFDSSNPDIRFELGGSLVKDSKSGNTPARDLNNYNDVLDLQADGMVGADSGLFADGGMMARGGATDVIVDNWNDIPDTFKKIILPKKIDWLPNPSNEGLFEIAKPFLDGDSLRPALTGINFDDNGITFTNSHILLTIPTTEHDYKGIYKKGSVKIDATYPNYAQVIPKEKLIDKILYIDILKLLTYCKVAKNYSGRNEITFKVNDSTMSFSPDYIIAFLTSLVKLTGNIFWNVGYQTSKQALLFDKYPSYELGKDIIGLIMPYINTKRTVYGTENKDKNAVLNVYYDFDDNEIRNADGSIVDLDVKPTKERAKRTPKTTPSKTSEPIGKFTAGEISAFKQIEDIVNENSFNDVSITEWQSAGTSSFFVTNDDTGQVFKLRSYGKSLGRVEGDEDGEKSRLLILKYLDWKKSTPTKETEKIEVDKLVGLSIDGTESFVRVYGATELLRNLKRLYKTFPERQNFPFRIYDINNNATDDTLNIGRGIETPTELITYIMDKPYYKDYEWTNFFAFDIYSTSSTEDTKEIVEQPKPSQTEKPKRNFELERKYLSQRISDLAKELDLKKPILSNEEVAFYQREINSFILKLRKVNDTEMSLKPIEERVRGVYDLQITSFDKQYEETDMTSINALKSQLTKEEYFTVRTPEFKSFFGDWETAYLNNSYAGVSKVINPVTKEPQPVFHGTNVLFVNWKTYDTNNAHYFAVKREFSEFFATSWETRSDKAGVDSETLKKLNPNRGSFLLRCFIDVKNPIDFSRFGVEKYPIREFLTFLRVNYNIGDFDFWTNITSHSGLTQDTEVYAWQIIRLWQSFTKYVKVFTTYDGYIFYEYIPTTPYGGLENASLSYCAFDSNQIKFTNAYEFNALSNDSRFDLGGIL